MCITPFPPTIAVTPTPTPTPLPDLISQNLVVSLAAPVASQTITFSGQIKNRNEICVKDLKVLTTKYIYNHLIQ